MRMPGVLPMHLQHEAPRLRERSVLSRVAFCALGLACCGAVVVAIVTACQIWVPDNSANSVASAHQLPQLGTGPTTYVSVHGTDPHPRRKSPIQRSVIQRLAMLKRNHGGRGVDMAWVAQMFPHWIAPDDPGNFEAQATLGDLVLAVAYLSQAEVED